MSLGNRTGLFGIWLDRYLREKESDFRVFYDHGDNQLENVGVIQGFVGAQPKRVNTLAQVDVMVVNKEGNIILLIEIEDKSSPSPKKLLGVVFSILFCNRFAFGVGASKQYFSITPDTHLIIAGFVNPKGHKAKQINQVIQPRLMEVNTSSDSIQLENITFAFEEDIYKTINVLEESVKNYLKL